MEPGSDVANGIRLRNEQRSGTLTRYLSAIGESYLRPTRDMFPLDLPPYTTKVELEMGVAEGTYGHGEACAWRRGLPQLSYGGCSGMEDEDEHLALLQLVAASSWSPSTSAGASVLQALEAKKDFIIYRNKYIHVIRSFAELPHRPAHAGSQLLQAQRCCILSSKITLRERCIHAPPMQWMHGWPSIPMDAWLAPPQAGDSSPEQAPPGPCRTLHP